MGVKESQFSHLFQRELPPLVSLQVVDVNQAIVFETTGKWLYPLFELEDFLTTHSLKSCEYFLHDRIAGKAAAALTCRLGFTHVKADMMSTLATSLYDTHNVQYSYTQLVDKILCQTETLFEHLNDVEEIYRIVNDRRVKSS